MVLTGQTVLHKSFGTGVVVSSDEDYIKVNFSAGNKTFVYPDAFSGFLQAGDQETMSLIALDLRQKEKRLQKEKEKDNRVTFAIKLREEMLNGKRKNKKAALKKCARENIAFRCDYSEGEMCPDWRIPAGVIQTGENKGKPVLLAKVQKNSLAVLTTRKPHTKDDTRYIFGVFLVDENGTGNKKDPGYVSSESEFRIRMAPSEAEQLKFWECCKTEEPSKVKQFGSARHRYLNDEQAARILREAAALKIGTADEELANRFYKHFCIVNHIS